MRFVNLDNFKNAEVQKEPFQYMIIENFLQDTYIRPLLFELNKLTPEKSYYHGTDETERTKIAFNSNLGHFIEYIFDELCSDNFIDILEEKFQINRLIRNNRNLHGAGIHKVYNNGFLAMHKDFNHTNDSNYGTIERRLNLLLYMNPEWKDEYGGHLCLYDERKNEITKRVLPILNRCVIFNTTDAIHGHPLPMSIPKDKCRQSLALYYYSKNTTGLSVSGKTLLTVQWYPEIY